MAAELVGGAFLTSLFEKFFERVTSSEVVDFFRRKKLDSGLLKKMKIMLLSVDVVLDDAEKKQISNPVVKEWLEELKEVVYDADQLMDEINTEILECKLEGESGGSKSKRLKLAATLFSTVDNTIECRIKEILDRLKFIIKQKEVLGLKVSVQSRSLQRLPAPLVEESVIYGRDNDKEKIIELLLTNDVNGNKISVIPIVGMGGIGKTTLAQLVYDDSRVKEHFDIKLWITVSVEFDVFKITKAMVERLTSQKCNTEDLYELQVKLKQTLLRKKFLVVYDDVWNENYIFWDVLKSPFESGAHGSKIVLTTRSEIVASKMGNIPIYTLQAISNDECWLLFVKHAFNDSDLSADLQEIGKEIVKKCKGLPLAVKSVAGLLRGVLDPEEWRRILKSDIWLESSCNNILPALWLSYHYLPPNLKRCFAYCSIFPKDYIYEKEEIILLWMAEGFLKPVKGKRIEDVGEEYFRDLILRSLFQRLSWDESTVTMHDLVHDLATFISGEFCFRLEAGNSHEIPEKVRHLSFVRMQGDVASKLDVFSGAESLRTFLPLKFSSSEHILSDRVLYDLLPRLRCVRVLSLSHYSNLIKLPDSIASLRHLRYLDLSHTPIEKLPASVSTLYNLQTLKLSHCASLTQLPHDIGRLVNLRHLFIDGTNLEEMPEQMSRLKNLQIVTMFVVGKGRGYSIKELKHFQNLRGTISILGLQNIDCASDVSEANIKDKKHLENLVLKWDPDSTADCQNALEVLTEMLPHINLKKLTIENYGGKAFPYWLGDPSFSNVVSLSLINCKKCVFWPPLGSLPSLKELSIEGFDLPSLKYFPLDLFPKLNRLHLEDCENLESLFLRCHDQDLTSLTFLQISECDNFQSFPLRGLPAPKLTWFWIEKCKKLKSLPKDMHSRLSSLQVFRISECPQLDYPKGGLPSSLCSLSISCCDEFVKGQTELNLQRLSLLRDFSINNCKIFKSFPPEGLLPPSLTSLYISGISNLTSLNYKELQHLTSLKELRIENCPELQSISKEKLPSSLSFIHITGSCLVNQHQWKRKRNLDWNC